MASGFVQRATEDQAILSEALDEDLMKEITELRSAYIHSTIVTFEDRVKKDLKETYEAEAAQVTKELEARAKELEDTDTEEAKEELDDIESGVHEIQRKCGRKKKEYQEPLRDALRGLREERGEPLRTTAMFLLSRSKKKRLWTPTTELLKRASLLSFLWSLQE